MLIKLKQGFGRLLRTEKDTGFVAILDSRVNIIGRYRLCVLNALPDCPVTGDINEIISFLRSVKPHEYWI
jgi:ATP-dependent DNA helicase DinG